MKVVTDDTPSPRGAQWAATMEGFTHDEVERAHRNSVAALDPGEPRVVDASIRRPAIRANSRKSPSSLPS
jgi:hypothetical protein